MRIFTSIALGIFLYSAQAQIFIPVSVTIPPIPTLELGNDTTTAIGVPIQLSATVSSGTPPHTFQWIPGSAVNNPSLQNPIALVDSTTTLTCIVTDANGCHASDDITVTIIPTGVPENISDRIRVYPNPSDGRINISGLELLQGDISIEVYDITGRKIFSEHGSIGFSTSILFSTPGLYSVHILGEGTQIIHKFIIMKSL